MAFGAFNPSHSRSAKATGWHGHPPSSLHHPAFLAFFSHCIHSWRFLQHRFAALYSFVDSPCVEFACEATVKPASAQVGRVSRFICETARPSVVAF